MEKLYLGIGTADITPPIGGQLYGYAPNVFSNTVEDRLNVSVFYFCQGDVRALMISATVCLINTALAHRIRNALAEKMAAAGIDVDAFDALSLAQQAGSAKAVNIVLMGRAAHHFDIPYEKWITAIENTVAPKFVEMNKKAFDLGYNA